MRKYKKELWLPIRGFKGLYEISSIGRVRSIERMAISKKTKTGRGCRYLVTDKILLQENIAGDYRRVALSRNDVVTRFTVHRLVAKHFIYNPFNKPQVNHKNGVKHDNRVENLEWVTAKENQRHAYETGLNVPKKGFEDSQSYPIVQKDISGKEITRFGSLLEAQRNGFPRTSVTRVINGERETCRGFVFERI